MTNKPKIGIVLGSVREVRLGEQIAQWVLEHARARGDAHYSIIDVKSFDLPLFTSPVPPAMANKQYDDPRVQAWSDAIDSQDGFVFVTSEYDHGIPGAFKNATDHLFSEFQNKTVGFVGYSGDGAIRAVEQWRTVLGSWSVHTVSPAVQLMLYVDASADMSTFTPADLRDGELAATLDAVVAAINARKG